MGVQGAQGAGRGAEDGGRRAGEELHTTVGGGFAFFYSFLRSFLCAVSLVRIIHRYLLGTGLGGGNGELAACRSRADCGWGARTVCISS